MKDLMSIEEKGLTIDSREVAQMVGKRHADLLRDIDTYISYFGQNAKLRSDDFFIESTYIAGTGKTYRCYEITEKGCEMIANKLTGEKGVIFTATYINKFHEMKSKLQQPKDSYMIADPIERAKAWIREQKAIKVLQEDSKYLKEIINNPSLVTITQIAKDYGMSGKQLNSILHNLKIQYKQNGQWLLYSSYQDKGYTHSKTIAFKHSDGRADTKMITEWTQNGRKFLYEMLKSINVLPLIEKTGVQISIQNSTNIQA